MTITIGHGTPPSLIVPCTRRTVTTRCADQQNPRDGAGEEEVEGIGPREAEPAERHLEPVEERAEDEHPESHRR